MDQEVYLSEDKLSGAFKAFDKVFFLVNLLGQEWQNISDRAKNDDRK